VLSFLRLHSHLDLALKNADLMRNHHFHLPVSDRGQKKQSLIILDWSPIRLRQLLIIATIKQPKLHHDRPHPLNPLFNQLARPDVARCCVADLIVLLHLNIFHIEVQTAQLIVLIHHLAHHIIK
jgi:hypothetical protein